MASPVATVAFIEGQAWAKAPDGSLRALSLGATLAPDEVLVTAEGARVELDFGEGDAVVIAGNQQVGMGPDLWEVTVRDPSEAALADASIQQALAILEEGGDLLEALEETAAGNTDAGSGGGNSFIQVARAARVEAAEQEFDYGTSNPFGTGASSTDGNAENKAPIVADMLFTLEEDTAISGRIAARDIENDPLTFTLVTGPAHGSLTFDTATGEFQYQPDANYFGSDSFLINVTDSWGNTTSGVVNLEITPVNDAPVADNLVLHTDEDVAVAGQVIGTDIEDDPLSYTVASEPAHGSVTLDSTTGNFVYTPHPDYHGNDSFDVLVDDGNGGTTTATVSIIVAPVNDAPVAADLHLLTDEDVPVSGQIIASDVDGDVLTYELTGLAESGTVVLDPATGSFTYTPDQDYYGNDSFVVTITDGQGGLTTSTVTIEIAPVNDAPVADNKHITTLEDTPYSGQITATDVEGDRLTFAVETAPANGRLSVDPATGSFVYVPSHNYYGGDSFVVVIDDGNGGTTTSTVTIDVLPVNDAPVSSDLYLTTNEDTPVSSAIIASDVDGDILTYTVANWPRNGSVSLDPASGNFVYTPAANYHGSDRFVVTISDGQGGSTTSTVTIGVLPVNDAPSANNLHLTTPEDTPVNGAIDARDPDGDPLTYSLSSAPANGNVTLDPSTGNFVYTPAAGYLGNDRFVVTINDGNGGTATSIVTIGVQSVAPVNQAPTANDDVATTKMVTPVTIAVRDNDTDPDVGDTLTVVAVGQGASGSVVIDPVSGNPVYTPDAGFFGNDSFTYTIEDSQGNRATATVRVEVSIHPVNNPPVAVDDPSGSSLYSVNLGSLGSGSWQAPDLTDSRGLTVSVSAQNADGSIGSLYRNGTQLGVAGSPRAPHMAKEEPDQIEYDVDTGTSESVILQFNDILTSARFSVSNLYASEDGGEVGLWVAYYQDVEVGRAPFQVSAGNADTFFINIGVVFDRVEFSSLNTVNQTGDGSGYFLTGFSGEGSPVVNGDYKVTENGILNVAAGSAAGLLANDSDPDGDTLMITHVNGITITDGTTLTLGTGGAQLTIFTDGSFRYSPNGSFDYLTFGEIGTDTFTYTVSDGFGGTATATAQVAVIGSDPAPVAAFSMAASHEFNSTAGSDVLVGTLGADTFKWNLNDQGAAGAPVEDQVIGFNASQGDVLNLADLLQGESNDTLTDYLHFTSDGTHTTVHISTQGGYASGSYDAAMTDQTIILQNVNLSGSDADIIHQLKSAGNLITD